VEGRSCFAGGSVTSRRRLPVSHRQFSKTLLLPGALLACSLTVVFAGDLPVIFGAPPGWEGAAGPVSIGPPGLDDTLRPFVEDSGTFTATLDGSDAAERGDGELFASALWEQRAAVPPEVRAQTVIELEPGRDVGPLDFIAAREISALWNCGRHQQAIERLRGMEEAGVQVSLGIGWTTRACLSAQASRRTMAGRRKRSEGLLRGDLSYPHSGIGRLRRSGRCGAEGLPPWV
jgi:hypothetical protein